MTIPFVLCADDYGMSPGVSEAICHLIQENRLSATSCMSVAPFWPEHAGWLREARGGADVGLHLTLTEYAPLGAMPRLASAGRLPELPDLMRAAFLGRLDGAEISAELHRQVDAFEEAFDEAPAFVDGHQHVHQLPIIRDVVIAILRGRLGGKAYVRTCIDAPAAILRRGVAVAKTTLIAALGIRFRRAALRSGIPTNASFRGIYGFAGAPDYASLFDRFLRDLRPNTLIMCHPGASDDRWLGPDVIVAQREAEYAFLASDRLPHALSRANARIEPFGAPPA